MKKKSLISILVFLILCLCGCTNPGPSSTFEIRFIDVGQGDSALVECDGHYMLIDGGSSSAGDKVYDVLVEKGIQKLDILAISHMHEDHIGGLYKALTFASPKRTISNSTYSDTEAFRKLERQLISNGAKITIPRIGEKFGLGSAKVEVVDVTADDPNDSLVLLVTYGKTRFLFTGDIEYDGQKRLVDKYANGGDTVFKVDVIKIPHHGSWGPGLFNNNNDLNMLMRTFKPDYAIISAGKDNIYGHPHSETLELLEQADVTVYRTDLNGDIIVKSNGNKVTVEPK